MSRKLHYILLHTIIVLSMIFSPISAAITPVPKSQTYSAIQPDSLLPPNNVSNSTCTNTANNITIDAITDNDTSLEDNQPATGQTAIPMNSANSITGLVDHWEQPVLAEEQANPIHDNIDETQLFIFNTDQGVQFTAYDFTNELQSANIRISMDGRGRVFDNIFVERLWRTVKYEDIYIKEYATVPALFTGLSDYFDLYNYERPHQSLDYCTPADIHFAVNVPIL